MGSTSNCLVQESNDLFVDEAMMTGETFPVEKAVALLPERFHQRSEEHTSELQSRLHLVCRLLLEKKKKTQIDPRTATDTQLSGIYRLFELLASHIRDHQQRPSGSVRDASRYKTCRILLQLSHSEA